MNHIDSSQNDWPELIPCPLQFLLFPSISSFPYAVPAGAVVSTGKSFMRGISSKASQSLAASVCLWHRVPSAQCIMVTVSLSQWRVSFSLIRDTKILWADGVVIQW